MANKGSGSWSCSPLRAKTKKLYRTALHFFLSLLPLSLRAWIMRRAVRVSYELPEGVEFKIAESREELEQAFEILYAAFVELGYMDHNESRIRVTKYHAVPGTMVMIAKLKGEVIATISVIPDSPLGLPMESTWDLASIRRSFPRIAEISALTVKKDYRGLKLSLMFPLCKFMYEVSFGYAGIDAYVISTLERAKDYYRVFLLFQPIDGLKVKRYKFVKGVKAVAQYLDLTRVPENYFEKYGSLPLEKNLYQYFVKARFSAFQYPTRKPFRCLYPGLNPETLAYFFCARTQIFSELSNQERQSLTDTYFYSEYAQLIGSPDPHDARRKEPRFKVNCQAVLVHESQPNIVPVTLISVSRSGVAFRTPQAHEPGSIVDLRFKTTSSEGISLKIAVVFQRDGQAGCRILSGSCSRWSTLIEELEGGRGIRKAVTR